MFNIGRYQTKCGYDAVIAQIKSIGTNSWILRGVVVGEKSGILFLMFWKPDGKSYTGDPDFDLVNPKYDGARSDSR